MFASAAVVAALTIAVKLVAFLKELVVAKKFGTSVEVEIFLVAVAIPAALAVSVGGAFHDSFVPAYAKRRRTDAAGARLLASNTLWIALGSTLVLSLAVAIFRNPLLELAGGSLPAEHKLRSAGLLFLLLPYFVAISLTHVVKGYLRSHDHYVVSSLAQGLVPLTVVLALLLLPGEPSGLWLAGGTSLGAGLCLALLLWNAKPRTILRRPTADSETKSVFRHALPLIAAITLFEFFTVVDTMMATLLPQGNVAALSYGGRTCGVFVLGGIAVVTALMPKLSDAVAETDWTKLKKIAAMLAGLIVAGSVPVVTFLVLAAEPIVAFLFQRGAFTPDDTLKVAEVVRFAALEVPAYTLAVLACKIVTSLRATRTVVLVTLFALLGNVGLNFWFMQLLGVAGIVLSTVVVQALSAAAYFLAAWAIVRKRRQEPVGQG